MDPQGRKSLVESLLHNIGRVRRFRTWVVQTCLSAIVLCAMCDNVHPSDRGGKEKFVIATSCISLSISFIVSIAHHIKALKAIIVQTVIELVCAIINLSFCIGGTVIITSPKNKIATTVLTNTGTEIVVIPNLYFSSWLALLSSIYLLVSFFYCIHQSSANTNNNKIIGWLALFSISLIMLGTSADLKDGICDMDNNKQRCTRTIFAIVLSVVVLLFSLIALILYSLEKITPKVSLALSSPTAGLCVSGVVMLTSANGPGLTLGSMYFTIWSSAFLSCWILITSFNDTYNNEPSTNTTSSSNNDEESQEVVAHTTVATEEDNVSEEKNEE